MMIIIIVIIIIIINNIIKHIMINKGSYKKVKIILRVNTHIILNKGINYFIWAIGFKKMKRFKQINSGKKWWYDMLEIF
jgi:hypothetical protein